MNPYTENKNRLADVIASIQVMGIYKFYKENLSKWAYRISGSIEKADYWENIFRARPEFFRIDSTGSQVSLVWRRTYQKLYDVDSEEKITRQEFRNLTMDQKKRISRTP